MFCVVKDLEHLGMGKVIDVSESDWTVEYFDSPENYERHIEYVSKKRIIRRILGPNTRVFYYSDTHSKWLVGRVITDFADNVDVRFAKKNDVTLNYSDLYVRWKKPIQDPAEYLSNLITETPQYAEARSKFLKSYIAQRGACWGISALMSSVIDLNPHQINVIRRVLSDPSQRYLLADEVGLGKTIEAGVIIRQAVLDDPEGHHIVVLVPPTLIYQWRQELVRRFCLDDFIDESVVVLPQEDNHKTRENLDKATMLVIDEAHRLTSDSDPKKLEFYGIVGASAKKVDRLILLSATPALRNEPGFLKMLHLLDPVVYSLEDGIAFRTKIQHRQTLAEAVASLVPENALMLNWVVEDLHAKLPYDVHLKELSVRLKNELERLPEEDDPDLNEAIRQLRAHLSETYKLHRRILRNRRKHVEFLTPGREGCNVWVIQDGQVQQLESILEEWRINAFSSIHGEFDSSRARCLTSFYREAIKSLVEGPSRLKQICNDRIRSIKGDDAGYSFEREKDLLKKILSSFDEESWLKSRIDRLVTGLNEVLVDQTKAVIYCSGKVTADKVFSELRRDFSFKVVRHEVAMNDDDESSWSEFLSDRSVKVLVCDSSAEEGINLQGGNKVAIHFDLPMSPNRIEQRMGRLDRYGSGEPIRSYVLCDENSKYQRSWYRVLEYGLGVFNRSIASLQYLVDETIHELENSILIEGVEYLDELAEQLGNPAGSVSRELKLIDEQDGLDELSPLVEKETESVEETDDEWKKIREAFDYWVVQTLQFDQVPVERTTLDAKIEQTFRFQYCKPGEGGRATLIPLSGFLADFIGVLDYSAPGSNSSRPRSYPYVYRRASATNRGVRLLRYGDIFVEAIKSFSELDDRGRSFAMWRYYPKIEGPNFEDPKLYFCFDFLIETYLADAFKILDASFLANTKTAQSALVRRGDALFAPSLTRVWIDEDGEESDKAFVQTYLECPYVREEVAQKEGYFDKNLNVGRLSQLEEALPNYFIGWRERCTHMLQRARTILVQSNEFREKQQEAIERARIQDEIRYAQLDTRINILHGMESETEHKQLLIEKNLNESLYEGINNPSIKLDVVGAVFLSRHSFVEVTRNV